MSKGEVKECRGHKTFTLSLRSAQMPKKIIFQHSDHDVLLGQADKADKADRQATFVSVDNHDPSSPHAFLRFSHG